MTENLLSGLSLRNQSNFGLLQELRAAYEAEAQATGNERLMVTAAVGAGKDKIDTAYDVPNIGP